MKKSKRLPFVNDRSGPIKMTAISVAVATALAGPVVQAQEPGETLEEVVVMGFRKSLEDAMNAKRSNDGVVDAINAEDIGKFPNTRRVNKPCKW